MDLFDTFTRHSSVRDFQPRPLSKELKQKLVTVAQSGSSSNFVQAYSIIEVSDPEKLAAIEKIAGAPKYITRTGVFYLFVADLHKHQQLLTQAGVPDTHLTTMEPFIVSVVDTTIAAQNMVAYAEAQDLGICYIGGIRNDLPRIAELVGLPKLTFPLFGLTIGYPQHRNEPKVRLPQEAIVSVDQYQPLTQEQTAQYNQTTEAYYAQRSSNQQQTNWQTKMTEFFREPRRPDVAAFMKQQGFSDHFGE